jgi:hypothetical protein
MVEKKFMFSLHVTSFTDGGGGYVVWSLCVVVVSDFDMCSQTGFSKSWRKYYI